MKEAEILAGKYLSGDRSTISNGIRALAKFLETIVTEYDQSYDTSRLDKVAKGLISKSVLKNTSKEVKVTAACCLAEILYIYAPDPPYEEDEELLKIFDLFVSVLGDGLSDPEKPTFQRHYYLLERLARVKSFTLFVELDEDLLVDLFENLFAVVNSKNKIIWPHVTEILCTCVEEIEQMIQKILEVILKQLLTSPSPMLLEDEEMVDEEKSPSYSIAASVLRKLADTLRPSLSHFLKLILQYGTSSERLAASEIPENLNKIIWELYCVEKSLLGPVLPDFGSALAVDNVEQRSEAVRVLSSIFGAPGQSPCPATVYRTLFNSFLGLFNDEDPSVRELMVEFASVFLRNYPEVAQTCGILDQLSQRIQDVDHEVRKFVVSEVCRSLRNAPSLSFSSQLLKVLHQIRDRLRDKKPEVRQATFVQLGKLYAHFVKSWGLVWSSRQRKLLGWIPSAILKCYFQTPVDIKLSVDEVMDDHILPSSAPLKQRVAILMENILPHLDDPSAMLALQTLIRDKAAFRQDFRRFLADPKLASNKAEMETLIARGFGKTAGAAFATLVRKIVGKDSRKSGDLGAKFKKLCGAGAKHDAIRKAKLEIRSVAGNSKYHNKEAGRILGMMAQRLSMTLFCEDTVLACLKKVEELPSEEPSRICILELFGKLSGSVSWLFSTAAEYLCGHMDESPEVFLHILSFLGSSSFDFPNDFKKSLPQFCLEGSPEESKYSVRIIKKSLSAATSKEMIRSVLKKTAQNIKLAVRVEKDDIEESISLWESVLSGVVAVGEIARVDPSSLSVIQPIVQTVTEKFFSDEFVEALESYSPLASDLQHFSIKLLLKYAESCAKDERKEKEAASIVVTFRKILHVEDEIRLVDESRLRQSCAGCLIKLASSNKHDRIFSENDFISISSTILDEDIALSSYFAKCIHVNLMTGKLPLRYLATLTLSSGNQPIAHECRHFLSLAIAKRRKRFKEKPSNDADILCHFLPEYAVPYVIHLLAHSPIFRDEDSSTRSKSTACLELFLNELFVGSEFPLVIYTLELLKTSTEDCLNQTPEGREAICILCDIALAIATAKRGTKHWSQDKTKCPLEFRLPTRLFDMLEEPTDSSESHLPENFRLPDHSARSKMLEETKSKGQGAAKKGQERKRSAKFGDTNAKPKKRSKKGKEKDEEEDEEEDEDEEMEEVSLPKRTSPRRPLRAKGKQVKQMKEDSDSDASESEDGSESEDDNDDEDFRAAPKKKASASPSKRASKSPTKKSPLKKSPVKKSPVKPTPKRSSRRRN